jgi:hypothetical protein
MMKHLLFCLSTRHETAFQQRQANKNAELTGRSTLRQPGFTLMDPSLSVLLLAKGFALLEWSISEKFFSSIGVAVTS